MKRYVPYFQLDKSVGESMIAKFRKDYAENLKTIIPHPAYERHIENALKNIYSAGVIASNDLSLLDRDSVAKIQVIDRNMSKQEAVSDVFTFKQAYEKLIGADTVRYRKSLLQKCNLNDYITPNLTYDAERSETAKQELFRELSWANGFVMNGQKIIDRGEIVDENTYNILKSLEKEWDKRSETVTEKRLTLLGQLLFVAIVPFAMIPMIIRIFLDSRTAFMAHVITVLLCSVCLRSPHEFILLQTLAGMVGIYSLRELSQRSQLLRSAVLVAFSYAVMYLALDLIHVSEWEQLNTRMYVNFLLNGALLLFTYPLLFILEKLFGFTSNVTLVELSNINNKLMREMSEVAPGTFQHSLQLANLTAAAANRIGADSQLVRTGAMYHDIGKMLNPVFFTENQSGVNPHDQLSYKQSAQIVINHVTDGMKLADKNNLPLVIKDFIRTHHGKGLTKYFYISYKNEHPDEDVDMSVFRYPGPNPFTKEQAILMMADSVEAASRSLPSYTEDSISSLVDKIVDAQVQEGYFKDCPITFRDIETVKTVFKEKLKTMYHTRIQYPELKK